MFWILWTVLALRADAFTIEPIDVPVTTGIPITVTWHRELNESQPFAIVKSSVGQGEVNDSFATVTINANPTQIEGTAEITFMQTTKFVLLAVQTGSTPSTFYTDPQTVTAIPPTDTANGIDTDGPSTTGSSNMTPTRTYRNLNSGTASETTSRTDRSSDGTRTRNIIIGSTVGGGATFLILLLVLFLLCRRRNRKPKRVSTSTSGSGLLFDKERMVKPSPPKVDSEAIYSPISRSSTPAPSFTETVVTAVTYATEIPRPRARTDRQMEIEEKIQSLQGEIISVSRLYGHSSPEEAAIREKIARLQSLKEGDWALERSDEKPREMW